MHLKVEDFSAILPYDEQFIAMASRTQDLLWRINHTHPHKELERQALFSQLLGGYHNTAIASPFHCDVGSNIYIGQGGFINYGLVVTDIAEVHIGNNVLIGPRVQLCAAGHPILAENRAAPVSCGEPIHIGNQVWLGAGAIVLGGVTIGDNSVIGAGSIVNKDIPANVVAVGNPCKVIKQLPKSEAPSAAHQQDNPFYHFD